MSFFVPPLVRLARRFNLNGPQVLLVYIAGIVTALLVLAVYEAMKAAG